MAISIPRSVDEVSAYERIALRERLLKILDSHLTPGALPASVEDSTGLLGHGVGLDSIEVLALVCAIEQAFHICISDDDLERVHFETVGSLVTLVEQRLAS
jgi:acyl carrier protein